VAGSEGPTYVYSCTQVRVAYSTLALDRGNSSADVTFVDSAAREFCDAAQLCFCAVRKPFRCGPQAFTGSGGSVLIPREAKGCVHHAEVGGPRASRRA